MRQEMHRRLVITLTSAAMLFGFAAVSSATSITFQLGTVFSGPTPAGTAPFVTVNFVSDVDCPICGVFDPEGGFFNGTTLVTITNNLAGNEFVRTVLLNVGPGVNPSNAFQRGPLFQISSMSLGGGPDLVLADTTGGHFDLFYGFIEGFAPGHTLQFFITGPAPGNATAFNFGTPDGPHFFAAAEIGGVGDAGVTSWVAATGPAAVPEPASMLLLGTGLVGMGARRWRNRRQRGYCLLLHGAKRS